MLVVLVEPAGAALVVGVGAAAVVVVVSRGATVVVVVSLGATVVVVVDVLELLEVPAVVDVVVPVSTEPGQVPGAVGLVVDVVVPLAVLSPSSGAGAAVDAVATGNDGAASEAPGDRFGALAARAGSPGGDAWETAAAGPARPGGTRDAADGPDTAVATHSATTRELDLRWKRAMLDEYRPASEPG